MTAPIVIRAANANPAKDEEKSKRIAMDAVVPANACPAWGLETRAAFKVLEGRVISVKERDYVLSAKGHAKRMGNAPDALGDKNVPVAREANTACTI